MSGHAEPVVDLALVTDEETEELIPRLAALFDLPASAIAERFESAASGAQITLAEGLTQEEALLVALSPDRATGQSDRLADERARLGLFGDEARAAGGRDPHALLAQRQEALEGQALAAAQGRHAALGSGQPHAHVALDRDGVGMPWAKTLRDADSSLLDLRQLDTQPLE